MNAENLGAQMKMLLTGEKEKGGGKIWWWSNFCLESSGVNWSCLVEKGKRHHRLRRRPEHRRGDTKLTKNVGGNVRCSDGFWAEWRRAVVRDKFREEDKGNRMEGTMAYKALASSCGSWEAPQPQSTLSFLPTAKHTPTCPPHSQNYHQEKKVHMTTKDILECSTAPSFVRAPNQKQSNIYQ